MVLAMKTTILIGQYLPRKLSQTEKWAVFLDGRATWHNGFNDTPYDFLRRIEIMIAYIHGEWGGAWEGHLPAGPDGLRSTTT